MKNPIILLIIAIALTSCGGNVVFKEYKKLDNISWDRFDVLNFELEVKKDQLLDFDLLLRHHTLYPYDYLDINITFYPPSGGQMSRDYKFKLKDKEGKWLASGAGDFWDIELNIRDEMKFNKDGICKVRLENKMTKIKLPGIIEVGLKAKVH